MTTPSTGRLMSRDSNIDLFFQENNRHIEAFNKRVSEIVEQYLEGPSAEGKDKKTMWQEVMTLSEQQLPSFVSLNEAYAPTLKPLVLAEVTSIFNHKLQQKHWWFMVPNFQYVLTPKDQLPIWVGSNPEVFQTEDILEVTVFANLIISDIPTDNLEMKEREVQAVASEDFIEQLNGHLGHNPDSHFRPYSQGVIDRIGIVFDKSKPIKNGSAQWTIPVELIYSDGPDVIETQIIQKYELNNGSLRISKGNNVLFESEIT